MGLGLGIVLLLGGLVLVLDVIDYDIPNVDDNSLGWLLVVVGAAAIILTLVLWAIRSRRATTVEERTYDTAPPRV
jgi:hypothetical protein